MLCPKCRQPCDEGGRFCGNCGQQLETAAPSAGPARTIAIVAAAVIVLLAVGTIWWWLQSRISDKPGMDEPARSQESRMPEEAGAQPQGDPQVLEESTDLPGESDAVSTDEPGIPPAYREVLNQMPTELLESAYFVNDDGVENMDWAVYSKWEIADFTKEIDAGNDIMYYHRSTRHYLAGDLTNARADIRKAIEHYPDKAHNYAQSAFIYMANDDYDMALQDALRAVELAPDKPDEKPSFYALAGLVYAARGDYDLAMDFYSQSIDLQTEGVWEASYSGRGYVQLQKGWYEQALADLEFILARPDDLRKEKPFYLLRGLTYCMMERYEEALHDFDDLLEMESDYTLAAELRALTVSEMQGDTSA